MVLTWAPISNDSSNICQGLEMDLLRKPGPPSVAFVSVNLGLSLFLDLCVVIQLYFGYKCRNHVYLRSRTFLSFCLLGFGLVCVTTASGLRRGMVNSEGHTLMPCQLTIILYCLTAYIFASMNAMRIILVSNLKRTTQLIKLRGRIVVVGEEESEHTTTHHTQDDEDLNGLSLGLRIRFGFRILFAMEEKDPVTDSTIDVKAYDKKFALLQWASSSQMTVFILAVLGVLWLVPPCIAFICTPLYHGYCVGCDIYLDLLIFLTWSAVFLEILHIRFAYYLKKKEDPDNVVKDLDRANYFAVSYLLFWVLKGVDPGLHDFENRMAYEWFFVFPLFMIWYFTCVHPLWVIWSLSRKNHSILTVQNRSGPNLLALNNLGAQEDTLRLWELIQAPIHSPQSLSFEKFMESRFSLENLRFLQDVSGFKRYFSDRGEVWRISKSRMLIKTYIQVDSVMEINVSGKCRNELLEEFKRIESAKLPVRLELFDSAFLSVFEMVKFGDFARFEKGQESQYRE